MREEIKRINETLKAAPVSLTNVWPDQGHEFEVGQIWEISSEDEDFPFVLVLKKMPKVVNICPIFRWTEKAGPEDIFLPKEFCGTPMIVCFELEATITPEVLRSCKGRLGGKSMEYILEGRKLLEKEDPTEEERKKYTFGWEYLDELDGRYAYHEKIAIKITEMQTDLAEILWPSSLI